jgi:hemoglobin-like flavoprotein
VVPIAATAADLFYGRLFEIAPEVRPMFPEDMKEQKVKLMAMLGTAVINLHKLDEILPAVKALGERHKSYGVTTAHYAPVGAALLWTLEQGLGADFTPDVKAAWTETYTALAGVMTSA